MVFTDAVLLPVNIQDGSEAALHQVFSSLNGIGVVNNLNAGYPKEAFIKMIGGIEGFFQGDAISDATAVAKGPENEHKDDREHQAEKNRGRVGKDGFEACLGDGQ